jgi:hypothetical protein
MFIISRLTPLYDEVKKLSINSELYYSGRGEFERCVQLPVPLQCSYAHRRDGFQQVVYNFLNYLNIFFLHHFFPLSVAGVSVYNSLRN